MPFSQTKIKKHDGDGRTLRCGDRGRGLQNQIFTYILGCNPALLIHAQCFLFQSPSCAIMHHLFRPFLWLSSASLRRTFQQEVLHLKNDIAALRQPIIISCEVALNLPTLKQTVLHHLNSESKFSCLAYRGSNVRGC